MASISRSWLELTEDEAIDQTSRSAIHITTPWDRPDDRYLLGDLLQDTGSGAHGDQTQYL